MILRAHGIRIDLPQGWSGRVFSRDRGTATLHAGNFSLALNDGQFGEHSTASMRAGASFIAVTEYRAGSGLEPGRGLFAARRIPLPLDPTAFARSGLAHPRPGLVGSQHFLTISDRPLCLYVVLADGGGQRRRQLAVVDHVLRSLKIYRR